MDKLLDIKAHLQSEELSEVFYTLRLWHRRYHPEKFLWKPLQTDKNYKGDAIVSVDCPVGFWLWQRWGNECVAAFLSS